MNIYLVNILLALVWGSYYVLAKYAVKDLGIYITGFLVELVATVFIAGAALRKLEITRFVSFIRMYPLTLVVAFNSFMLNITFLAGLTISGAINASIILRFDIIITLFIGYMFYGYRLSVRDYISILCMLGSLSLLLSHNIAEYRLNALGDIFFLISAAFLALNAFLIRHKLKDVPNTIIAICNSATVCIGFLLFALLNNHLDRISLLVLRWDLLLSIVTAGIFVGLIVLIYYYCLSRLEVWIVRTILLSIPGFTVLLGYIILHETVDVLQIVGFGLMFIGYMIIVKRREEVVLE